MLNVAEIFYSLQGESTFAGLPFAFVRLAGCNLHCAYCDTPAAGEEGAPMPLEEILRRVERIGARHVEVTGGEPLLQTDTPLLCRRLLERGHTVLVETNGSLPVDTLPPGTIRIVDVKTPGSGEAGSFRDENLRAMSPPDQLKFVIGSRADFDWTVGFVAARLPGSALEMLLSPVTPGLAPAELAGWILKGNHPFRLQIQLHKLLRLP